MVLSCFTDDEADNVKKKKKVWVNEESDTILKEQKPEPRDEARVGETKKKKIIKRIIRTKQADGTVISREILITDPKEVTVCLTPVQSITHVCYLFLTSG
jgi:hypothetical protein